MKKDLKQFVAYCVAKERTYQVQKWGVQNHEPEKWHLISDEEHGEIAKAINDGDMDNYAVEITQTIAVLETALENHLNKTKKSIEHLEWYYANNTRRPNPQV